MNKAFVRESDDLSPRCPRCASLGEGVGPDTTTAFIRPETGVALGTDAYFCPYPLCQVAYFDTFERVVWVTDLVRPVYPKDPTAPICGCLGFSTDEIDEDLYEGGFTRTREHIQRVKSGEYPCRTSCVNGRGCIDALQAYYFKHRNRG